MPVKGESDEPDESTDTDQPTGESSNETGNKKRAIKEKSYGLTKFTPIQLLSSLFAEEETRILELILEGSNGDLLCAIENLVSGVIGLIRRLLRRRKACLEGRE